MHPARSNRGFTLIELMVAITVLLVLAIVAVPSLADVRARAAVRGAGDQLVSFWANAKLEAVKRDQSIAVVFRRSGDAMCLGATTTLTGCDCFTANACNAGQYPASQEDWNRVTMVGKPTLGPTDSDDVGLAVIDPKRGSLADATDVGGMTVQSPGARPYRLRLYVDVWARPYLCAPTDAIILPDYGNRQCAP